jgi:hypothetical protein
MGEILLTTPMNNNQYLLIFQCRPPVIFTNQLFLNFLLYFTTGMSLNLTFTYFFTFYYHNFLQHQTTGGKGIISTFKYQHMLNFSMILPLISLNQLLLPLILILILQATSGNIESQPGPDPNSAKSLNICHLNIRSILTASRLEELEDFVHTIHRFDVVALSETHLDSGDHDSQISINGYNLFRKDRDRRGGGVAFFIANHIQAFRRLDLEDPNTEMIWVETHYKKKKLI